MPIPAYWHHVRGERTWQGYKGENNASNYHWFDTTIRSILQHEVYIGSLVAQRQTHIFKVGKSFVPERAEKIYVGSCMEYRKIGRQGCTPHRIYEKDLYDAVLKDIREWAKLALEDEQAVLDRVMEHENDSGADTGVAIQKRLSLEKRLGEVEKVIAKLYEEIDRQHHTIPNQRPKDKHYGNVYNRLFCHG